MSGSGGWFDDYKVEMIDRKDGLGTARAADSTVMDERERSDDALVSVGGELDGGVVMATTEELN